MRFFSHQLIFQLSRDQLDVQDNSVLTLTIPGVRADPQVKGSVPQDWSPLWTPVTSPRPPVLLANRLQVRSSHDPLFRSDNLTKQLANSRKHFCLIILLGYYEGYKVSQVAPMEKNSPANAGDLRDVSLIPGSGRSLE